MLRNSRKKGKNKQKALVITALGIGLVLVLLAVFMSGKPDAPPKPDPGIVQTTKEGQIPVKTDLSGQEKEVVTGAIKDPKPIDYNAVKEAGDQKTLMDQRKDSLGIEDSLDMIVKSDESFIVGESKVSMQKILEQAFAQEGEVFEEELTASGSAAPVKIKEYGIYVVQPGDNLWNIHFGILRDYYKARGIDLSAQADEPGAMGKSSGIGKILKFSETMVIIYNLVEKKVAKDINLLTPLSKVVVYNMDAVFALLKEIDLEHVNTLQFDGKNIWIPAAKS